MFSFVHNFEKLVGQSITSKIKRIKNYRRNAYRVYEGY